MTVLDNHAVERSTCRLAGEVSPKDAPRRCRPRGMMSGVLNDDRKTLILLLISGVLMVGGFSVAGDQWSDSTNLTDWIEALATGAAFLAAVIAARYAAAVFAIEDGRDQRRLDAEVREQAEKVAAWVQLGTQTWGKDRVHSSLTLMVRNASDLPVYEFDVRFGIAITADGATFEHADHRILPTVPPGTPAITEKRPDVNVVLPASIADASAERRRQVMEDATDETRVYATFRDTGNRWWRRTVAGVLEGPFDQKPT